MKAASLARGLGLVAVVALVLVVLAELGARVWLARFASDDAFNRYASLTQLREREGSEFFVRHRYLGFAGQPSWSKGANRHNRHGFRGQEIPDPKPEGEYRVVCVGGSTTYTNAVEDHTQSYPALLERELRARGYANVRVINAGMHGWTSFETLINFQLRLLPLEPDLVIVYHGINDLKCRFVWPPETYLPDNSGALSFAPNLFVPPAWQHSLLARIVATNMGRMTPQRELAATLDLGTDNGHWPRFRRQLLRGNYPKAIFREVDVGHMLATNPPLWFERNLEQLITLARAADVDVCLATFAFRPQGLGGSSPGSAELAQGFAEMNAVLVDLSRRTDAMLYDFAAEVPLEEAYFADHVHVTEAGAALKARLFADFVARTYLAP